MVEQQQQQQHRPCNLQRLPNHLLNPKPTPNHLPKNSPSPHIVGVLENIKEAQVVDHEFLCCRQDHRVKAAPAPGRGVDLRKEGEGGEKAVRLATLTGETTELLNTGPLSLRRTIP